MIEGKNDEELKKMISRRETLCNVSAIFHVIKGARTLGNIKLRLNQFTLRTYHNLREEKSGRKNWPYALEHATEHARPLALLPNPKGLRTFPLGLFIRGKSCMATLSCSFAFSHLEVLSYNQN